MEATRTGAVLALLALCCAVASSQPRGEQPSRQALISAARDRVTVDAQVQIDVGSHGAAVRRLAVDVARDWVVSASDDKSARVWRLGSGEALHTLRVPVGPGEQGRLYGAAIHPQRAEVVVAGTGLAPLPGAATEATAHVFALATGQWQASFRLCHCEVKRLAWSPDGRWLIAATAGAERGVHAFDVQGRPAGHFATQGDAFGLSVHQAQLVATDLSGRLLVFPLGEGGLGTPRVLASPGPLPVSVGHSPDGRLAVVGHLSAQAPSIVELATGRTVRTLEPRERDLDAGQLMTVAWSADAARVWVGGRKARGRDYLLWAFDAATGESLATAPVATDSILDLVPLPGGRVAFAAFDGSWGVFDGRAGHGGQAGAPISPHRKSALAGAQRPSAMLTGPDGVLVSWQLAGGERLQFDLRLRRLALVETGVGHGARMRRGGAFSPEVQVADARGFFTGFYRLAGREIRLEPGETARAATFMPGSADAFVGTSRALQRVDESGQVLWRRAPGAEVNALVYANASERIITALSDGTVRWWHAASGEQLLAVLALPTGQWLAWTPDGYFDASAGGDTLAGWLVRPPGSERVEHHLLTRFRAAFRRPDLVDAALGIARAPRAAVAPPAAPPGVPSPVPLLLPPQLVAQAGKTAKSAGGPVSLPFALRAAEAGEARVNVRLNGRPWSSARVEMPARLDGTAPGRVDVALPSGRHLVQLIAIDAQGTSAPLDFDVQVDAPAAPREPGARPRLLALAVGVSEYAERSLNLGLAAKDATDFRATLAKLGGKRYRAVTTRLVVDAEATRQAVLQHLEWLATEATSDDVVIVFLAGHGAHDDEGRYHFITHDGDIARLAQTAVSEGELRGALAAIRGRIVLFADTCHAGSVTTTHAAALSRDHARLADELRAPENGVIVLASSARSEESLEVRSLGNGVFTKALVDGLSGRADLLRRGEITVKGLDYYVASQVAAMTKAAQNPVSLIPPGMPDFRLIELP